MAKTQRVQRPDGTVTVTVIGDDFMPIKPVEEYLAFLRAEQASPNTVKTYAKGLERWFTFLELVDTPWDAFTARQFGEWVTWLRTGDLPGTMRLGPAGEHLLAPRTVSIRAAAVLSLYRYHAAANGLDAPYGQLYSPLARRGRRPYVAMLDGIADRKRSGNDPSPLYKVKAGPRGRTPLLEPEQVQAILDGCSVQRADRTWTRGLPGLRNRLFFALLAETGMRMGEALSLRHDDIVLGQGGYPSVNIFPRQDHPRGARMKTSVHRQVPFGHDLEALYGEYVWALTDAGIDLVDENFTSGFIFVNGNGSHGDPFRPLRQETVYAAVRSLHLRVPAAGTDWTPHWLRHTHATALLLAGCPPHVVMRRLGHLDVQTTLDTYGWVTRDAELRTLAEWKNYSDRWKEALTS